MRKRRMRQPIGNGQPERLCGMAQSNILTKRSYCCNANKFLSGTVKKGRVFDQLWLIRQQPVKRADGQQRKFWTAWKCISNGDSRGQIVRLIEEKSFKTHSPKLLAVSNEWFLIGLLSNNCHLKKFDRSNSHRSILYQSQCVYTAVTTAVEFRGVERLIESQSFFDREPFAHQPTPLLSNEKESLIWFIAGHTIPYWPETGESKPFVHFNQSNRCRLHFRGSDTFTTSLLWLKIQSKIAQLSVPHLITPPWKISQIDQSTSSLFRCSNTYV
jgi:hypothetical protein